MVIRIENKNARAIFFAGGVLVSMVQLRISRYLDLFYECLDYHTITFKPAFEVAYPLVNNANMLIHTTFKVAYTLVNNANMLIHITFIHLFIIRQ